MTAKPQTPPDAYSHEREKHIATALRENLRKRKEQQLAKARKKD